jgi:hypothetical protein
LVRTLRLIYYHLKWISSLEDKSIKMMKLLVLQLILHLS